MNQYSMVVLIVLIVMVATVLKARYRHQSGPGMTNEESAETLRMREELKTLKERIAVLERIATDRENSLARQIEELRDR
ncbi:hypothetical protein E2493_05620 [Sphingomonas parva]|uniref:Phage shock protein B n=1 Tax=Sphingomonas parva TaxID=2555898 RepID=A0A4Y8ZTH0_9SPHN|nr:hypothetical protein [Sphingomonas parva]TFI59318.1 hypothetical protein E2493_05620 [Sphingomonas parva]